MTDGQGAAEVLEERRRLLSIGYRMLGSHAESEDAVQDTYARWFRMDEAERAAVEVPGAWLTTAMTRVCLNVLSSARHRRESYVGQWLPEPLAPGSPLVAVPVGVAPDDPAERAALADEVTMALMVVLEALTPAERVAFVLHDVFGYAFKEVAEIVGRTPQACRTLASAARRHVEEERRRVASVDQHRRVVESFLTACRTGDVAALVDALDPEAVVISDGGGHVSAARRPVVGADRVARFLLGAFARSDDLVASVEEGPGETRLVLRRGERVAVVVTFRVTGDRVDRVWLMLNPDKLGTW